MTGTVYQWHCLGSPPSTDPCDEAGTYTQTAQADSGPAVKHTKATGHCTVSHVAEWGDAA